MIDYEITYILRPALEEAEVDTRADAVSKIVTSRGGTVSQMEKLGKKRLAYEIADVREGWYVVMVFKSDAATAKELERQLKLQEDVLRSLLVFLDKKAIGAAAAAAARAPEPTAPV